MDQINEQIIDEELDKSSIYEEARNRFMAVYKIPAPEKPKLYNTEEPQPPSEDELNFFAIAGIEMMMLLSSTTAGVFFSAIASGGMFYAIEVVAFENNPIIGNILGIFAVVTGLIFFEGFLVAHGFIEGRKEGKITVSKVSYILALIILVAGGAWRGISYLYNQGQMSDMIFLILSAIILLIVSIFPTFLLDKSGASMGYIFNYVEVERKRLWEKYHEEHANWYKEFEDQRKEVDEEYARTYNEWFTKMDASFKNSSWNPLRTKVEHSQPKQVVQQQTINYRKMLADYLKQNSILPSQVHKTGVKRISDIAREILNREPNDNESNAFRQALLSFQREEAKRNGGMP